MSMGGERMTQPIQGPDYQIPRIEIVDEEPPAGVRAAAEEALADLVAGRSVICMSDDAFDALLRDLAGRLAGD